MLEGDLETARESFAPEIADHEAAITAVDARKEVALAGCSHCRDTATGAE